MKRSSFIKLSAFATAAISLPLLDACHRSGGKGAFSEPIFLSRLFDAETIKEVGNAYLQKAAGEKDEGKLIQLLADNPSIARSTDEKAIHQYLDEKIRREFAAGETIMVKGWILAPTEARQCALYVLIKR